MSRCGLFVGSLALSLGGVVSSRRNIETLTPASPVPAMLSTSSDKKIAALFAADVGLPSGTYTIQQAVNDRYLDAHLSGDFGAFTREKKQEERLHWLITTVGLNLYTVQQKSNNAPYLVAHEQPWLDYRAYTTVAPNDDSHKWLITKVGLNLYRVQQSKTNRYLDAVADDFDAVTEWTPNDDSQLWLIVGYYRMELGSCCCPRRQRLKTKAECHDAIEFLDLPSSGFFWKGTNDTIPGQCSWKDHGQWTMDNGQWTEGSGNGQWNVLLKNNKRNKPNNKGRGKKRSDMAPICKNI